MRGKGACGLGPGACLIGAGVVSAWLLGAATAAAQPSAPQAPPTAAGAASQAATGLPAPVQTMTFDEAVRRATAQNPSIAKAAAGILRAEGLLAQARAAARLYVSGSLTTTTINKSVSYQDVTVTPQNEVTGSLTVDMPIVAASDWARRAEAQDATHVAQLSADDARRQVAMATADAYLTVIDLKRVLDAETRAHDVASAHRDLAARLEQGGSGSRLDTLRAEQQVSSADVRVESARLGVYRAQEALGVLVAVDGAVDVSGEPAFDSAVPAEQAGVSLLERRTDLKLFSAQQDLASHVLRDTGKERWPTLHAIFQPQTIFPTPFFSRTNSWRFLLQMNVPIYTGGSVTAERIQNQAALDTARATLADGVAQANSDVRLARESIASDTRALASARVSATQASQVVDITNVSFQAGAATSIEVIDAERSSHDADTAVAQAEDALRRARLNLLIALGQFP